MGSSYRLEELSDQRGPDTWEPNGRTGPTCVFTALHERTGLSIAEKPVRVSKDHGMIAALVGWTDSYDEQKGKFRLLAHQTNTCQHVTVIIEHHQIVGALGHITEVDGTGEGHTLHLGTQHIMKHHRARSCIIPVDV